MSIEPPDSGDLDAIHEFVRSPGWALVSTRIAEELYRRRVQLEADADAVATANLRGQVGALGTVLRIPEILKAEIQGQLKKEKT